LLLFLEKFSKVFREHLIRRRAPDPQLCFVADLGLSLDLKSAEQKEKAVMPE